ncbi:hypothetical protein B7P43_G09010 [Cryptotermes secundus]|uniref:Uncharacterized protein n=1 Tax=Cryptotermes secundus TaxID=105785 RepID=A0A2J7PQ90_9NEOP|nr:hypothetical protein B7P43_G09010 [Cryptotermes secundus]
MSQRHRILKDFLDKRPKLRKMKVRFGKWNVRRLYRPGSLMTVAKKYQVHKTTTLAVKRRNFVSDRDIRSFRAADCGTDHYLVVAKVRERLAVSKQTTYGVHMERFNLKELNEVEGKEQYRVEISNRFAALENLDTEVDVNKA